MRSIFGVKVCPSARRVYMTYHASQDAYKIFTVDKVIGAIIKQVREFIPEVLGMN